MKNKIRLIFILSSLMLIILFQNCSKSGHEDAVVDNTEGYNKGIVTIAKLQKLQKYENGVVRAYGVICDVKLSKTYKLAAIRAVTESSDTVANLTLENVTYDLVNVLDVEPGSYYDILANLCDRTNSNDDVVFNIRIPPLAVTFYSSYFAKVIFHEYSELSPTQFNSLNAFYTSKEEMDRYDFQ